MSILQDRPWFKFWPEGVPQHLDYPEIPLFEILSRTAERWPENIAFSCQGRCLIYRELDELTSKLAAALNRPIRIVACDERGRRLGQAKFLRTAISRPDVKLKIRATLSAAIKASGKEILTIEGLRGENGGLHPLQEAFIEHFAVQCGYCTPGMILTAKALLDEKPAPTEAEVREGLYGNFCRCTGYVPIVRAVLAAAPKMRSGANHD